MIKLENLVHDLELRFTAGKPSQDFEVPQKQMAEWIDMSRDYVTRTVIEQMKYDIDDSIIMSDVLSEAVYNAGRDRIELPFSILPLDLNRSRGVVSLIDSNGEEYMKVSSRFIGEAKKMTFTKPSFCRYQYYVDGPNLVLFGPNKNTIGSLSFYINFVPAETQRVKEFTDRYYIMPSTISGVIDAAEEIGWREILQGKYDVSNDGVSNEDN